MNKPIVIVRTVIIHKGSILLLRRSPDDRDRPGDYDLPGGGPDEGESLEHAALREVEEETGLKLPLNILKKLSYPSPEQQEPGRHRHVFVVEYDSDVRPTIILSSEHVAFDWLLPSVVLDTFTHPVYNQAIRIGIKNGMIT